MAKVCKVDNKTVKSKAVKQPCSHNYPVATCLLSDDDRTIRGTYCTKCLEITDKVYLEKSVYRGRVSLVRFPYGKMIKKYPKLPIFEVDDISEIDSIKGVRCKSGKLQVNKI